MYFSLCFRQFRQQRSSPLTLALRPTCVEPCALQCRQGRALSPARRRMLPLLVAAQTFPQVASGRAGGHSGPLPFLMRIPVSHRLRSSSWQCILQVALRPACVVFCAPFPLRHRWVQCLCPVDDKQVPLLLMPALALVHAATGRACARLGASIHYAAVRSRLHGCLVGQVSRAGHGEV